MNSGTEDINSNLNNNTNNQTNTTINPLNQGSNSNAQNNTINNQNNPNNGLNNNIINQVTSNPIGEKKPLEEKSDLVVNSPLKTSPLVDNNQNNAPKPNPLSDSPLRSNPLKSSPLMDNNQNSTPKPSPLSDSPLRSNTSNNNVKANPFDDLKGFNSNLAQNKDNSPVTTRQDDALKYNNLDLLNNSGNVMDKTLEDKSFENNIDFIQSYIGKNNKKILHRKFNFGTFFFTSYYLFYRRFVITGLAYVILLGLLFSINFNLVVNKKIALKDSLYFVLGVVVIKIILSFVFNKVYVKRAYKNTIKIKEKSHNKDKHSIRVELARKGGPRKILFLAGIFFNASCIAAVVSLVILPFLRQTLTNVLALPVEDTTDYDYFKAEAKKIYTDLDNVWAGNLFKVGYNIESYSDINDEACGYSIYDTKNEEKKKKNANKSVVKEETKKEEKEVKEVVKESESEESQDESLETLPKEEDKKIINYVISKDKQGYVTKYYATYLDYRFAYDGKNLQPGSIADGVYLLRKEDHEYCKRYLGKYCYNIYKKIVDSYIQNFIKKQEKIKKGEYNFKLECQNDKPTIINLN